MHHKSVRIASIIALFASLLTYTGFGAAIYLFALVSILGIPIAMFLWVLPTLTLAFVLSMSIWTFLRKIALMPDAVAGVLAFGIVATGFYVVPEQVNRRLIADAVAAKASDFDSIVPRPAETIGLKFDRTFSDEAMTAELLLRGLATSVVRYEDRSSATYRFVAGENCNRPSYSLPADLAAEVKSRAEAGLCLIFNPHDGPPVDLLLEVSKAPWPARDAVPHVNSLSVALSRFEENEMVPIYRETVVSVDGLLTPPIMSISPKDLGGSLRPGFELRRLEADGLAPLYSHYDQEKLIDLIKRATGR